MNNVNFNSSFKNFIMLIFIGLNCHSFAGEEKEDDPFTAFFNPNLNVIQTGFNRKGIIDEEGHKKKAYFILKDFYLKFN